MGAGYDFVEATLIAATLGTHTGGVVSIPCSGTRDHYCTRSPPGCWPDLHVLSVNMSRPIRVLFGWTGSLRAFANEESGHRSRVSHLLSGGRFSRSAASVGTRQSLAPIAMAIPVAAPTEQSVMSQEFSDTRTSGHLGQNRARWCGHFSDGIGRVPETESSR